MKSFQKSLLALAPIACMFVGTGLASAASADDVVSTDPGVITEEVISTRKDRRAEMANMSDEERTAAREERRQSQGERSGRQGGMSDADRQARKEKMQSMSNEERRAAREANGGRRGSGNGQGRGQGNGQGKHRRGGA